MKKIRLITCPLLLCLGYTGCTKKGGVPPTAEVAKAFEAPKKEVILRGDLVRAVADGDFGKVKDLLDRNAEPNESVSDVPGEALNPLLAAVAIGREDLVTLLKDRKAVSGVTFKGYDADDFARFFFQGVDQGFTPGGGAGATAIGPGVASGIGPGFLSDDDRPVVSDPAPEKVKTNRQIKKFAVAEADDWVFRALTKANVLSDTSQFGKFPLLGWVAKIEKSLQKKMIRPSEDQWRMLFQGAIERYRARRKQILTSSGGKFRDLRFRFFKAGVQSISELLQGSPEFLALGEEAKSVVHRETNQLLMSFVQSYSQASSFFPQAIPVEQKMVELWQQSDKYLISLSQAGSDDAFRQAYNESFALDSGIFLKSPARDNLERFREAFRQKIESEETLRVNGTGSPNPSEFEESARRVMDALGDAVDEAGTLTVDYEMVRKESRTLFNAAFSDWEKNQAWVAGYLANRSLKQEKASQLRYLLPLKYSAADFTLSMLNSLTADLDKDGKALHFATGEAILGITRALETYSLNRPEGEEKNDASRYGISAFSWDVGMQSSFLFSFFESVGYPDQLYFEEIKELAQQMSSLRGIFISDATRYPDKRIANVFENVAAGFQEIDVNLKKWANEGKKQGEVIKHTRLSEVFFKLRAYLSGLLAYDEGAAFNELQNTLDKRLPSCRPGMEEFTVTNFDWCLFNLTVVPGELPSLGWVESERDDVVFGSLYTEREKGLWKNLPLVSRALKKAFSYDALVSEGGRQVAICDEWRATSQRFLKFVSAYPKYFQIRQEPVRERLSSLAALGEECRKVSSLGYSGGASPDDSGDHTAVAQKPESHLLLKVLDRYGDGLRDIQNAAKKQWDDLEKAESNGLDLTKKIEEQKVRARLIKVDVWGNVLSSIGQCPDEERRDPYLDRPNLLYPKDLGEEVPNEFHIATVLGLGVIYVCYKNVQWDKASEERRVWFAVGNDTKIKTHEVLEKMMVYNREPFMSLSDWQRMYEKYPRERKNLKPTFGTIHSKVALDLKFTFYKENDGNQPLDFMNVRVTSPKVASRYWKIIQYSEKTKKKMAAPSKKNKAGKENESVKKEVVDPEPLHNLEWETLLEDNNGGDGPGWSRAPWAGHSLLHDELSKVWFSKMGMRERFRELLQQNSIPLKEQAKREMFGIVKEKFNRLKSDLNDKFRVWMDHVQVVSEKTKAVSGLKALLKSIYALGFPESLYGNDDVHDAFFGSVPLLDSVGIPLALSESSLNVFLYQEYLAEMGKKLARLKEITIDIISKRANREKQASMEEVRDGLELMRMAMEFGDTRAPIASVYRQLQNRVRAFAATKRTGTLPKSEAKE